MLVWEAVAHLCCIVLPGAVPREQHSLYSASFSLSAPLMRVPVSLPFTSAVPSFFLFFFLSLHL